MSLKKAMGDIRELLDPKLVSKFNTSRLVVEIASSSGALSSFDEIIAKLEKERGLNDKEQQEITEDLAHATEQRDIARSFFGACVLELDRRVPIPAKAER